MDVTHIIDPLNEPQRTAVTTSARQALVLAGAGSGKTRVLTHRIAWVAAVDGVSPYNVLAVTFTNKAAAEMRNRVESLLGLNTGAMWIGTFHGISHRLLRTHWREANLPQGFQILDSDDQLRLIKRLMKNLNIDEARWPPKQAMWYINGNKEEGLRPQHMDEPIDPYHQQMLRIYVEYEATCQRNGVIDFAGLLLNALELLRDNDELQRHYRMRFEHILVDEFQDTNALQYAWLKMLAGDNGNLFAVGDDDQSIYGWRGAKVENILNFHKDFAGSEVVRLEQNYRSTGTILKAANALINNNGGRLGKELWTSASDGEPITLFTAYNEGDEARFVVDRIKDWLQSGGALSGSAILYRSNAQSRVLEQMLTSESVPYRIYGGLRFFERAEIKDVLSYLRLLSSRLDDVSFERAVNQPPRGIGEKTLQNVRDTARNQGMSLWHAATALCANQALTARATKALQGFLDIVDSTHDETKELELHEMVEHVIARSGLIEHYKKDQSDKGQNRVENLEELVTAARASHITPEEQEDGMSPLEHFLANATLDSGEKNTDANTDRVQLMTLHAAKGLEFPLVFMVGMEEGLFPSQQSVEDTSRLEEERRLCYVGITRAEKQLVMCQAESRRIHGREMYCSPSRFLGELPTELLQEVRVRSNITRPVHASGHFSNSTPSADGLPYNIGSMVTHEKFGDGVVTGVEGSGAHARVQVNFSDHGSKWLVAAYAKLQILG